MSRVLPRFVAFAGALALARADVYMHMPIGANNRLDEGGGNRNNNNRLMDSQNNGKGGYGYGGSAANKAAPLKYMAGSQLSVAWTAQHSCGSENSECQMVVQYMCNDQATAPAGVPTSANANSIGEGPMRDGTDGNSPDPNNPDANRGLHEPTSFYQDCEARDRNGGLYISDQNVNNNDGATATRQNPNGARSGLECPEERDYYPYWHPSPWKDLAIMTNNMALCTWYAAESQNVKAKNYCTVASENNEDDCTGAGGDWVEMAPFGIDPPMCLSAPFTRDNHLGNPAGEGSEMTLNISIPAGAGTNGIDDAENCAIRLRYNITTSDTRVCEDQSITTKEECEAAGLIWSAAYVDSSYNDQSENDPDEGGVALPQQNPNVDLGGFLSGTGGTNSELELAINTNQYGRTFQDRSHVFSIQERPASLSSNSKIFNLNVRGKRGNIVQAYPAVEYDFHPPDLEVGLNDFVHIQWTGNDNTNNNGNNNGEGTNNEDRHNIVQVAETGLDIPATPGAQSGTTDMFDVTFEWNPETTGQFAGTRDQAELTKQFALVKQTGCLTADQVNGDQQAQNCEKLNAASATVDLGMLKFNAGTYKYMSSRNNNFSNRAQKAVLNVLDTNTAPPRPPVNVVATAVAGSNSARQKVQLNWKAAGGTDYKATDGKWVTGVSEAAWQTASYFVELSYDGGQEWFMVADCWPVTQPECLVEDLMAGTTYAFRVYAAGDGGSAPTTAAENVHDRRLDGHDYHQPASEIATVQTEHSSLSSSCESQLLAQADGQYLTTGAIVGIVLGVIAGLLLLALAYYLCRRRAPPPPPPDFKAGGA